MNSDADGEHVTLKTKLQAQEPNKVTSPAKFSVITPPSDPLGSPNQLLELGPCFCVFLVCGFHVFLFLQCLFVFSSCSSSLSLLPSLFSPCSSLSLLPSLFPPSKIVPWPLMVYFIRAALRSLELCIVFGWTVGVPVDTAWMHQGL